MSVAGNDAFDVSVIGQHWGGERLFFPFVFFFFQINLIYGKYFMLTSLQYVEVSTAVKRML